MNSKIESDFANSSHWSTKDIYNCLQENKIVAFIRGTEEKPLCGFSKLVIDMMHKCAEPFKLINVLEHNSIKPALTKYSGDRGAPLVFVNGKAIQTSLDLEWFLEHEQEEKIIEQIKEAA